jgi:flotillin
VKQISNAKGFDRLINESENASHIKAALLGDSAENGNLMERISELAAKYNISTNDLKNLTIASLLLKMQSNAGTEDKPALMNLANMVNNLGFANRKLNQI